mgnify:CR=1 FL=1
MMKTLMVQGTTSDAGKSTLVAGLCRVFANLNYNVAPFKPQNMALNSAVTEDGGEIGRAQALQAVAANQKLRVDFNPILLKPNSDTGAQVIIHGKAISNMEAAGYHDYKKVAMQAVLDSHQRLTAEFDMLLVEGAGSPAEINLRENDIANMGYAEEVNCPVILIADIDKGGVFAHLVGTLELLSKSEQNRVKGFVINRFRGDIGLLQSGLDWLEEKTGKPVLGVLPYLHDLALDAEDAISVQNVVHNAQIKIVVVVLPHISNHTDFDVLRLNPDVDLEYVRIFEPLPACDLLILPGSKNVIGDLQHLATQNWLEPIARHLRYGGKLLGICGGYQMLGKRLLDPNHVESSTEEQQGLSLADFETELTANKQLTQVSATAIFGNSKAQVNGYEIHCGQSQGKALNTPAFSFVKEGQVHTDGFVSEDGQVMGTYLHGLFDSPQMCQAIFDWLKPDHKIAQHIDINEHRETQLNTLAEVCTQHLDITKIQQILEQGNV